MPEITSHAAPPTSRAKYIAIWVFRIVIALMFLTAASFHLAGPPYMVNEFDIVGLGQWFRYFTGTLELIGVALVLTPRFSGLGGLVLLTVDTGAFIAEITRLHVDWLHAVLLGLVLVYFIYLQRHTLTGRRS